MEKYKQLLIKLLLAENIGPVFIYRALSLIAGIADQADVISFYSRDLAQLESALEFIIAAPTSFFISNGLSTSKTIEKIKTSLATVDLQKELQDVARESVTVDSCFDDEYPVLLKNIYAPPVILYRQGMALGSRVNCLSVVGSREASAYGFSCVDELLTPLVRSGLILVSGGALGIDSSAHRLSVKFNVETVAVMGSGLNFLYPFGNKMLFKEILSTGGTIISPFSMSQRPERGTFPARNRIIAGIAPACLVIEAGERSGALITASYALESGRTVCAVPGSIFSPTSIGCNQLIKQGAAMITSASDLLSEFGLDADQYSKVSNEVVSSQSDLGQENDLFVFLSKSARSEEDLAIFLGKDMAFVQDLLFDLQLDGKIQQQFTGLWGLPSK